MCQIALVCGVLILMDILSGVVAAAKNGEVSSAIMREGLYHKIGEVLLLALAMFGEFILGMHPFTDIGIPPEISYTVGAYIAFMEIVSILENICKLNPELPLSKLFYLFNIKIDTPSQNMVESEAAPKE